MIVVNTLANGNKEIFQTGNYIIGTKKDLHPIILKSVVMSDTGKKIAKISRRNKWYYKHFVFPTEKVQQLLQKEQEMVDQESNKTE